MMISDFSIRRGLFKALAFTIILGATYDAAAQDNAFASGWKLQPASSSLNFQSVKNATKVESSSFATLSGTIDPNGKAQIIVNLESVDTKIDLRNVRMRFLFFESFQYPEATVTAQIDLAQLADLSQVRRKTIQLPYTLDLHGVKKASEAQVVATLLNDDLVSISTSTPISVAAEDFALTKGIRKLEEAAGVTIIPSASVTFDFMFARNSASATTNTTEKTEPSSAALEAEGNFDSAACLGRFDILSKSDGVYFKSGSTRLDPKSAPLLDNLADIISRCPGMIIEIGGHTDSDGSAAVNKWLSTARAKSVIAYLASKDIASNRTVGVGYGEEKPVAPNDTRKNKSRNRRIDFAVINE